MVANAAMRQSFFTALTDTKSTDVEGVGTLRRDQFGNVYRWVQNVDGSAITVGMVVSHDLTDTSTMLTAVDCGQDTDLSVMAGVVMAASVATLYYCWIQVLGFNASALVSITATAITITAGNYLKPVTAVLYAVLDTATQPLYARNLQILEGIAAVTQTASLAAAAAKDVLVNCL